MTVTNQYVAPIEVAEMPGGLLQTSRPLPLADWRGGLTFLSTCTTVNRWGCLVPDGETGELEPKDIGSRSEPVRFDPFLLYSGVECSGAPDEQELRGIARAGLVRGRSGEIAHELVDSLFGNPDLSTYAVDVTPTGEGTNPDLVPVGLAESISILLGFNASCGGGEVVLHTHISALPYLLRLGVQWNGSEYKLGAITVSVDEYPFTVENESFSEVPSLAPIYMTRPVEVKVDSVIDEYDVETRINRGTALSEDLAILRFDTCCAYSIITDLSVDAA